MEGSRCFAGVCQKKKKKHFPDYIWFSNSRPTDIRTVYFIFFFFFLSVYLFPFWFWFFHGLIIAFRLVTPSLTHDSFVCILAGSYMRSEGEKRKGKPTRRVKLTIDYTATVRVGIYGFKRRRVAAELLSSTSSFKKWEKKKYWQATSITRRRAQCRRRQWLGFFQKTEQDKLAYTRTSLVLASPSPYKSLFTTFKQ